MTTPSTRGLGPGLSIAISRGLQSLATPIIALLVTEGAALSGGMAEPLTYCNVLVVGNLCAAAVALFAFGPNEIKADIVGLPRRAKFEMLVFGGLSAALSAMIYAALGSTTVASAILLARLGPLIYAVAAAWLLHTAIRKAEWAGFAFTAAGVLVATLVSTRLMPGRGEALILGSAVVFAAVTTLSKRLLSHVRIGTVVFARNGISAVCFLILGSVLYGPMHFADAYRGDLWVVMLIYGSVIVVLGQLAWYHGIKKADASTVAKYSALTPAMAIAAGFVINGQTPSSIQLLSLGLVTFGVIISDFSRFFPKSAGQSVEGTLAGG